MMISILTSAIKRILPKLNKNATPIDPIHNVGDKPKNVETTVDKYGLTAEERFLVVTKNLELAGLNGSGGSRLMVIVNMFVAAIQIIFFSHGNLPGSSIDLIVGVSCLWACVITLFRGGKCSCPELMCKNAAGVCVLGLIGKTVVWFTDGGRLDSNSQAQLFISMAVICCNLSVSITSVYFNAQELNIDKQEEQEQNDEEVEKMMKVINEKLKAYCDAKNMNKKLKKEIMCDGMDVDINDSHDGEGSKKENKKEIDDKPKEMAAEVKIEM